MMVKPFCIIGTPRSRTTWFSKFLTYDDIVCRHEPSRHWKSNKDMEDYFKDGIGASDSMLTLKWQQLRNIGVNLIAIIRPLDEVAQSAKASGMAVTPALSTVYNSIIPKLPNDIPKYQFSGLDAPSCADIFERCLGRSCPLDWLLQWRSVIVNPDYDKAVSDVSSNPHLAQFLFGE